jgi:hypothetical protein
MRRGWLLLTLGCVAVAGLASCADPTQLSGARRRPVPVPPQPAQADPKVGLSMWADFPVGASRRPLVLVAPEVRDPARGFATGADKQAYGTGAITWPTHFPDGPVAAGGYRVISAEEAAERLAPAGKPGTPPRPRSLRVTAMRLGTASFSTDRGDRVLPAWLFSFAGVADPAAVLAVDPSARYRPVGQTGTMSMAGAGAQVSRDGRTLRVTYLGGRPGSGVCSGDETAAAVETSTAVAIVFTPVLNPPQPSPVVCPDFGVLHTASVPLRARLGARVAITPDGDPYQVVPAR